MSRAWTWLNVDRLYQTRTLAFGVMRLVIIIGSVYGIIFGFLNSLRPLLPPPPTTTQQRRSRQCPRQRTTR